KHFQVALKAAALVVDVGENGKVGRLIERVFDAAQDQRAVRVGHVEDHDSDSVAALAAERAGKEVRPVTQLLGRLFDSLLGFGRNIAGKRRIVKHDGDGGGGKSAFLRHFPYRDNRPFDHEVNPTLLLADTTAPKKSLSSSRPPSRVSTVAQAPF